MSERIRALLTARNPWWRDHRARPPGLQPYKRKALPALVRRVLSPDPAGGRALLLTGLRRVGKTELARQVVDRALRGGRFRPTDVAFIQADDARVEGALSLARVLEAWEPHRDLERMGLLVVDEIQRLSDPESPGGAAWAGQLQGVVDDPTLRLQVLATGSAALRLRDGGGAGAGRWDRQILEPLSFREFRELRHLKRSGEEVPSREHRFEDLQCYLALGGFPEFSGEQSPRRAYERIRGYADAVLRTDVGEVRSPLRVVQLLAILLDESGGELNVREVSRELGANRESIDRWLRDFEDAYLVQVVRRLDTRELRELRGNPRVYGTDPGLVAAFSTNPAPLSDGLVRGSLAEAAVLRHLREVATRAHGRITCAPRRTTKGKGGGIDFVLHAPNDVFFIEVTAGTRRLTEKARYVREVMDHAAGPMRLSPTVRDRELHGMVVHGGAVDEPRHVACVSLATFLERVLDSTSTTAEEALAPLRAMARGNP